MAVIPNHRGAAQKCAVGNDLLEGSDLCKMWAMVLKKNKTVGKHCIIVFQNSDLTSATFDFEV